MDEQEWLAAQTEWSNPENWRMFGCYVAPRDPRLWVRKREPSLGWTLNFAHRSSWLWLIFLIAVPVGMVVVRALAR